MSLGRNGSESLIAKYAKIVRYANSSISTKCWDLLEPHDALYVGNTGDVVTSFGDLRRR